MISQTASANPTPGVWENKAAYTGTIGVTAACYAENAGVKYVYAFEGKGAPDYVYRYGIAANTWTNMYNMAVTATSGISVVWNRADNIYWLSGGTTPSFYAYYISSNTKSAALAVPPQRAASGSTLAYDGGDNIYALLVNSNTKQSWIYVYKISTNGWTFIDNTPEAIGTGGGLIRLGNYLYVASSIFATQVGHFLRYDLVNSKWDWLASLPNSPTTYWDSGDGLENVGTNYIYANVGGSGQTDFFRFSIPENKWYSLQNTPGAQSNAGDRLASDGTYLYLVRAYTDSSFWRYQPPTYGVYVSISPSYKSGIPCTTLSYTVTVKNLGYAEDTFDLTVTDNAGWGPTLDNYTLGPIPPGENRTATLSVTVPDNAIVGTSDTVTVTATSKTDNTVSGSNSCIAQVTTFRGVNVSISPGYKSGPNGATLTYTATVNNTGTVPDNYSLTVTDNAGWSPSVLPTTLNLSAGSSGDATLSVTVPDDAAELAQDNITVTATSQTDNTVNDSNSCIAQVTTIRGVSVSISPTSQSGKNGATLTYTVTVNNTGNVSDTYTLENTDTLSWTKSLSNTSVGPISPSAFDNTTTLSVTIPGNAIDDTIDNITVTANGTGVSASARCTAKFTILTEWVYVSSSPNSSNYAKGVTGAGENIYIADSSTSGGDIFMCYNTVTGQWTTSAPPVHMKNGTALVWDNRNYIYMILGGSYDDTDRHYFYRYKISTNTWENRLNTPGVNQGAGDAITWVPGSALGVSGDNYIFAIVGKEGGGSDFLRYSISSNTWVKIGTTWTRNTFPAETDDGCSLVWTGGTYLYALRGEDWDMPSEGAQARPLYDFWRYDIVNDNWEVKENIPAYPHDNIGSIPGGGGVGDGGSLLWIGGYLSDYIYAFSGNQWYPEPIYDNRFYLYTISANIWERLTDLPQGVGDHNGPRLGFASGKIYYWRGCEGGKDLWAYTPESGLDNTPPPAPSLVSPANGENMSDNTPTFRWAAVTDLSLPVTYTLQVDNDSNFSYPEVDVSGLIDNAYTPATELADGTYYWHVHAVDNAGNVGEWSATWSLHIGIVRGVEVAITPPAQENENGGTLAYTVTVKNTGNVQENFQLTKGDNAGWTLALDNTWLLVPNGENRTTTLRVTIPENADNGTEDNITVTATSQENSQISANASCIAHAGFTAEEFSLHLLAGWNLVGFPLENENATPSNLFAGLSYTMYYWTGTGYKAPDKTKPVEDNRGYWVKVNEDTTITYSGIRSSDTPGGGVKTMHFLAGWNLVCFPWTSANTTPANLFAGTTYTMYYWTGTGYKAPDKTKPVEDNRGYWVKVNQIWSVQIPI